MAMTLSYMPLHAQGRGHAYGRHKHEVQIRQVRPSVRVYTAPAPRAYYYRRPSVSLSFPFGYSTYQPYRSYYYPNGTLEARRDRDIRIRREREQRERIQRERFAHERRER